MIKTHKIISEEIQKILDKKSVEDIYAKNLQKV